MYGRWLRRERRPTYEESPAVRANGTVRPSARPMMTSRSIGPLLEWCSGWTSLGGPDRSEGREMSLDGVLGFRLMKEGSFSLLCMLAVYRRA